MEIESGKVFVGGISWDTNEERLREYFQAFGEVEEAVIMKDRATGRARGFGFIVFTDASVAEKVVRERHIINGKAVEAKKAVPRDEYRSSNRTNNNSSIQGLPSPPRTKKIFVGGLPSTAKESDIRRYFDQFGTITDAVVMYDHNTQRPRGFGFITYSSEEAVDRVLYRAFHELNGKMVEVKRAVPRELSPGSTRSPPRAYTYGMNRMNANSYIYGYDSSYPGGHGMRINGCYNPLTVGRNGHLPNSPLNLNYGAIGDSNLDHGRRMMSPQHNMNTSRYGSPIGCDEGVNRNGLLLRNQNPWDNRIHGYHSNNVMAGSGNENVGLFGSLDQIWGTGTLPAQTDDFGYGKGNVNSIERAGYGRDNGDAAGGLHGIDSYFGEHSWHAFSADVKSLMSFGNQTDAAADAMPNDSLLGYVGGCV